MYKTGEMSFGALKRRLIDLPPCNKLLCMIQGETEIIKVTANTADAFNAEGNFSLFLNARNARKHNPIVRKIVNTAQGGIAAPSPNILASVRSTFIPSHE